MWHQSRHGLQAVWSTVLKLWDSLLFFNWNIYLFLRMCLATVPSSWVMKTAIIAGSFVAACCYLVAQSCWTLCSPMDSSLWDFPGKNTEVGCLFLLQGSSQPRSQTSVSCIGKQIFLLLLHSRYNLSDLGWSRASRGLHLHFSYEGEIQCAHMHTLCSLVSWLFADSLPFSHQGSP